MIILNSGSLQTYFFFTLGPILNSSWLQTSYVQTFWPYYTDLGQAEDSSDVGCSKHRQDLSPVSCSMAVVSFVSLTSGFPASGTADNTARAAQPSFAPVVTPLWAKAHTRSSPLLYSPGPGEASPAATLWDAWAWTVPRTLLPDLLSSPFHAYRGFHAAKHGVSTSASRGKSV